MQVQQKDLTLFEKKSFAKKSFGQNFLIDQNVISKIVKLLEIEKTDNILEIGPGLGSLTFEMMQYEKKDLTCIEKDKEASDFLQNQIPDLKIINSDALKFDFNKSNFNKIISNLPYNVGTDILKKILTSEGKMPNKMVLMFQTEVAKKICAKPMSKNYLPISILSQILFNVSIALKVPQNCFTPQPHIESSVVVFQKNDTFEEFNKKEFLIFLNSLFSNRRKTVGKTQKRPDDLSPKEIFLLHKIQV